MHVKSKEKQQKLGRLQQRHFFIIRTVTVSGACPSATFEEAQLNTFEFLTRCTFYRAKTARLFFEDLLIQVLDMVKEESTSRSRGRGGRGTHLIYTHT